MNEEENAIHILSDKRFPYIDVALRKGYHFNDDEVDHWQFLIQAKNELSDFYAKYNAELVYDPEGFIFLAAHDSLLRQSRLKAGEMIIGQVLALFSADPAILRNGGRIRIEELMVRIGHLVPPEQIPSLFYAVRTRKIRTDLDSAKFKESVEKYLRSLAGLGFLTLDREGHIRPNRSIFRFASLARVGVNRDEILEQLEKAGYASQLTTIANEMNDDPSSSNEVDEELALENQQEFELTLNRNSSENVLQS